LFFGHFTVQSFEHGLFDHFLSFLSFEVVFHFFVDYFMVGTDFTHSLGLFVCYFSFDGINEGSAIGGDFFG
jgi:hypothetical protein